MKKAENLIEHKNYNYIKRRVENLMKNNTEVNNLNQT